MNYRKAYGLPERYFLSLGRMVEKKNLSTLIAAYARFARASVERSKAEAGNLNRSGAEIAQGKPELPETADGEKQGAWSVEHGVGPPARRPYGSERSMEQRANLTENCKLSRGLGRQPSGKTEHCPPGLVFVGSGELEGALRDQARSLGLRVVDRTDWKVNGREKAQEGGGGETVFRKDGVSVGESSETRDSQPSALNEENRGTVFFYGFRQIEENPVFYALAEAFVLPSLKEEWGLVVNEAMACSLPVIVSRTAGCAEDLVPASGSVEHGAWSMESGNNSETDDCQLKTENSLEQRSNGFVFDPKSSDALSEALRRIADQDTKRPKDEETNGLTEMGRRSREIVAKFSCENFARQALRAAEKASAA